MDRTVTAQVSAVEAGRRRTAHRVTLIEGVRQTGTERCNIDDSHFHPRPITDAELEVARAEHRLCHWCYP